MPYTAINASASVETSTSGSTMQSVPSTDRNVIRHSSMMAPNTRASIGFSAAATSSLVAAITPTFPVARRKISRSGVTSSSSAKASSSSLSRRNVTSVIFRSSLSSLTRSTTRLMVSARWSVVNTITGMALQSRFSSPVSVSTLFSACRNR